MASTQPQDKRLLERAMRRGKLSRQEAESSSETHPDMADRLQQPNPEELEQLKEELGAEAVARKERIERFLEEGPLPEEKAEPVPIDENDL